MRLNILPKRSKLNQNCAPWVYKTIKYLRVNIDTKVGRHSLFSSSLHRLTVGSLLSQRTTTWDHIYQAKLPKGCWIESPIAQDSEHTQSADTLGHQLSTCIHGAHTNKDTRCPSARPSVVHLLTDVTSRGKHNSNMLIRLKYIIELHSYGVRSPC